MERKALIIYRVTNNINGKIYIGLTTSTLPERKKVHKSKAFSTVVEYNRVFYNAIRKYGWDNFSWDILETLNTEEDLKNREIFWISHYKSFIGFPDAHGYNMTLGGEGTFGRVGELAHNAKLNSKKVAEIKKLLIAGQSHPTIAKEFGVDKTTISLIAIEKQWKDVDVEGWDDYLNREYKGKKFTSTQVAEIKKLLLSGKRQRHVAAMFETSEYNIYDIARNNIWSHVTVEGWENYKPMAGNSKLTDDMVREIKTMILSGVKQKDIASKFGISKTTISGIATNKIRADIVVEGWDTEYKGKQK